MTLNFWSSSLHLLITEITGVYCHVQITWYWGSNLRLCACHVNTIPVESHARAQVSPSARKSGRCITRQFLSVIVSDRGIVILTGHYYNNLPLEIFKSTNELDFLSLFPSSFVLRVGKEPRALHKLSKRSITELRPQVKFPFPSLHSLSSTLKGNS